MGARLAIAASVALLLASCAALAPAPPESARDRAWQSRRAVLAEVSHWRALGRVSVQTPGQALHAGLVWDQEGERYRVRLLGPLGQATAEIAGGNDEVTLRTSRGEQYRASDPESLMAQNLGWWVPVRGLRHWLLGRDDPGEGVGSAELDPEGRPLGFTQGGWAIRYLDYGPGTPVALPGRVELERDDVRVRVLINRWELGPS